MQDHALSRADRYFDGKSLNCVRSGCPRLRNGEMSWFGTWCRPVLGEHRNCNCWNMGALDRFDYTMMGDMVNLAAWWESGAVRCLHHGYGETKLASEQHMMIRIQIFGQDMVKGRSQPVAMFEPTDLCLSYLRRLRIIRLLPSGDR